jgi:nitrogen fixation NifU-like protein
MDRQTAIERMLDHYQNPRNHGALDPADVAMPGGQPDCGDQVTIYLKVHAGDDTIERVTFEGRGCTVSQAAASILTELAAGRPLAEIEEMEPGAMIDILGRQVVSTRPRCATLAINTLKSAIVKYRSDQSRALIEG